MENRVLYSASEWGEDRPAKHRTKGEREKQKREGSKEKKRGGSRGQRGRNIAKPGREREREEGEGNREGETYLFDFRMSGLISFLKLLKFCLPCLHLTHVHTMKHYSQLLRLLTLCL